METFKFFGPAGLIELLKVGTWDEVGNFPALGLGGYCLTRPEDDLCSVKYAVTVEDEVGNSFSTDGYCFPTMLMAVKEGGPCWKENKIGKRVLKRKKDKKNPCLYKITVGVKEGEVITGEVR